MMRMLAYHATMGFALAGGLTACASTDATDQAAFAPEYLGVDIRPLDNDLANVFVSMRGARDRADVAAYADCAAADYAKKWHFGYLRHIRTRVSKTNGQWKGDAIYVFSPEKPLGEKTIDAAVRLADCTKNGIPRV